MEQPPQLLRSLHADPDDDPECDSFVCLQQNDPQLKILAIGSDATLGEDDDDCYFFDFPHEGDWGRLGECIGSSEYLEELCFGAMEGVSEEQFHELCTGMARNRSIRRLEFVQPNLFGGREFDMLTPFLVHNGGIESFRIRDISLPYTEHHFSSDGMRILLDAIKQFSSLKEIVLRFDGIEHDTLSEGLVEALAGHSALQTIDILGNKIGAIGSLLESPNSHLHSLKLSWSSIDDAGALALGNGVDGNTTLKTLELSSISGILLEGWRAVFGALRNPKCGIEELLLRNNHFNDDSAIALADSLANNASIKSLDLSTNSDLGRDGGRGWEAIFGVLRSHDHPDVALENLFLQGERYRDDDIADLASALGVNNKLRELDLSCNNLVSSEAWQEFSAVLRRPDTALEKLSLVRNAVNNDDTAIAFAGSLAGNTKLSELVLGTDSTEDLRPGITDVGWKAFGRVMYNQTSITATFLSNHTLRRISIRRGRWIDPGQIPKPLYSLFWLNRRSQTARLKIIKSHFFLGDKFDQSIKELADLDLKVLPRFLEWLGRDEQLQFDAKKKRAGNSILYRFVRAMPKVFSCCDREGKRGEHWLS